jgi:hypothetical protein
MVTNMGSALRQIVQHIRDPRWLAPWAGGGLVLAGLYAVDLYSDILFHSLSEAFSIAVAAGIFMVAWNAREFLDDHLLLWLGVGSLLVACVDLLHMLAYAGIGALPREGNDVATQLWLAARFLQAAALLGAPAYLTRRLDARLALGLGGALAALVLAAIVGWRIVPSTQTASGQPSAFKTLSELAICLILAAAVGFLARKRHLLHPDVYRLLAASMVAGMASAVVLAPVSHTHGVVNAVGHLLKIVAVYFLYKATIETALLKPYALLFRSLKQSEDELRSALGEVKQLSGMLPICSSCKHIRNDQGYWQEVEVYLTEHSEAVFSHGLCPSCAHRLYPEYFPAPETLRS